MNVSGSVIFNPNSSARFNDPANQGIAGVPVVLQRRVSGSTSTGVVVFTDSRGNYVVQNVPAGAYQIVEAWGMRGGVASPANFNNATTITSVPQDPVVTAVSNLPAGANQMNSLSPNTLFINVVAADITNQSFLDAPIQEIALNLNTYVTMGNNLVTLADRGTWGLLPNGTPVQTSPSIEPYPVTTRFIYIQYQARRPADGQYSVSNTITNNNFGTWWNLSDHKTGNETGRMQIVNGDFPGQSFFEETIMIKKNTPYVFSVWVCNVDYEIGSVLPRLRIVIRDLGGMVIYSQNLSGSLPTTALPTWNQVGKVFNSGSHGQITVDFISEGSAAGGNDFVIDDISLFELEPTPVTSFPKTVNLSAVLAGGELDYTLTFTNSGPSTVRNAIFKDVLPPDVTIIPGTLVINNVIVDDTQIETGILIGTVLPGDTVNISLSVVTNSNIHTNTQITNTGEMSYQFVDSTGLIRDVTLESMAATTLIVPTTCPICPTGPMGPQGIAGATGVSGPKGATGVQGSIGPVGQAGVAGAVGAAGPEGPAGQQGERGLQGLQGDEGPAGPQGVEGLEGPVGPTGPQGNIGPRGSTGSQGSIGPQGNTGAKGSTGEQGPTGPLGPVGPQGAQGLIGLQGVQGPRGQVGPTGPQGMRGAKGVEGIPGPRGERGLIGATGLRGIPGPAGPIGAQGVMGPVGPMGMIGPTGSVGATGPMGKCECSTEIYGQFILSKRIICTSIGRVALKCSLTGTMPLRVDRKKIYLYAGYVYYVSWSVQSILYEGDNALKVGLFFNNSLVKESINEIDIFLNRVQKMTLTGSAIINMDHTADYISLEYDTCDCRAIDICNASVKIITVAKIEK